MGNFRRNPNACRLKKRDFGNFGDKREVNAGSSFTRMAQKLSRFHLLNLTVSEFAEASLSVRVES